MAKKKKAVKAKKKAAAPKKKVAKKAVKKAKAPAKSKSKAVAKKAVAKKRPAPKKKKAFSEFPFGNLQITRLVLGIDKNSGKGYLKVIDMNQSTFVFLAFDSANDLILRMDAKQNLKAVTSVSLKTPPPVKASSITALASTLVTEDGHIKGNLTDNTSFNESLQGIVSITGKDNTVAIGLVHQDDDKDND
ncbi:MAG: hypothetical protein U0V74_08275 [Chitinophagales bacterium]